MTIYRQQWLVPLEEHSTLLTFWNPLYHEICDSKWVHCCHGLYRGNIGLVCEHNNSSKAKLIVTFIPCIHNKHPSLAQKCKWPLHPELQKWSTDWAKAVWGNKVWKILDKEYKMKDETYTSGQWSSCPSLLQVLLSPLHQVVLCLSLWLHTSPHCHFTAGDMATSQNCIHR